jgi:glutamate---cysteine ligase / carboxylate-amine ligase
MSAPPYPLFARYGVELEYMIVDRRTLSVLPCADRLIKTVSGDVNGEVIRGPLAWSNELALHVIELKTAQPAASLDSMAEIFQSEVRHINDLLAAENAMLLPTAAHPWMNPERESKLWPHDNSQIYHAFHRVFNCRGHGWTNLQSAHLNLPFATAEEFARLHTAIRLVLPLLPALAASSPFLDGCRGQFLDMRLATYRRNCSRIPSVTGSVVPEPITSPKAYVQTILSPIFRDLAPLDPDGTLQHEWVNARGAIPRFDRHTIEVRVLDVQECPAADLAIIQFLSALLQRLTDGSLTPLADQLKPRTHSLSGLMDRTARDAGAAKVRSEAFLKALGVSKMRGWRVRDLWWHLLAHTASNTDHWWRPWIETILNDGTLSERILRATGSSPDRQRLHSVYQHLADCLASGICFNTRSSAGSPARMNLSSTGPNMTAIGLP